MEKKDCEILSGYDRILNESLSVTVSKYKFGEKILSMRNKLRSGEISEDEAMGYLKEEKEVIASFYQDHLNGRCGGCIICLAEELGGKINEEHPYKFAAVVIGRIFGVRYGILLLSIHQLSERLPVLGIVFKIRDRLQQNPLARLILGDFPSYDQKIADLEKQMEQKRGATKDNQDDKPEGPAPEVNPDSETNPAPEVNPDSETLQSGKSS